jgi:hypothetical protein
MVLKKKGKQISRSNHQDVAGTVHQYGVQYAAAFLVHKPIQDAHCKNVDQSKDIQFGDRKW